MQTTCKTDVEHVKSLKTGDRQSLDFFYKKYYTSVFKTILKVVKTTENAEEIVHDVFLAFWENRSKMAEVDTVEPWLVTVSFNKSINFIKKEIQRSLRTTIPHDLISDLSIASEEYDASTEEKLALIEKAVEQLSERKKKVFQLYYYEGKKQKEIATLLSISTETVKDYLKSSKKQITEYMGSTYPWAVYIFLYCIYVH